MATISAIRGQVYERPSIVEGITFPDVTFAAAVGVPFDQTGPVVTRIEKTRDGHGISGFYDRLTVWAGDDLLFECAAWAAQIEYQAAS